MRGKILILAMSVILAGVCGACYGRQEGFTERINIIFNDGTVMIYRGGGKGMAVGQSYTVFIQSREIGKIEIFRVEEHFCMGKIISDNGLKEGEQYSFAQAGGPAPPASTDKKDGGKKTDDKTDPQKTDSGGKTGSGGKTDTKKNDKKNTDKKEKSDNKDKDQSGEKDAGDAAKQTADAAKPETGGGQAFVPAALNRGGIISLIQKNQLSYCNNENLEFEFNYSDSSFGTTWYTNVEKNIEITLSYELLRERMKNGVWIDADLTYEDQKSDGVTKNGNWAGFVYYGYKSYLNKTGQGYVFGEAGIGQGIDSEYNNYEMQEVTYKATTSSLKMGYGYGRPVDVGAWRSARDIQDVLIKHGLIKSSLPEKTFVRIAEAISDTQGNILVKAVFIRRIHDILMEDKALEKDDFNIDISFEIAGILDKRMRSLLQGLEWRAGYKRYTTERGKACSRSCRQVMNDYDMKGEVTNIDVFYWTPLSDVLQLKFNPQYYIHKVKDYYGGVVSSQKLNAFTARLTLDYGISDKLDLRAMYEYHKIKSNAGYKIKSKDFGLVLVYKIW